jgi:PKD repeat protein
MKKVIYLGVIFTILLYSCESTPSAHFFTDTSEPEVGQTVIFNNDSHNARDFEWDFGDGYISNESNPSHVFTASGPVTVKLTAISKSGLSDEASMDLTVMVPTLLVIQVREYYQEYVVPDASVYLYPTLSDWDDQTNLQTSGLTNEDGVVVFANLDPYVYYVDVWEANHDNYTLRDEDVGFIRTPEILPHQINYFTAWVDVADHGKGTARGDKRPLVIKKLERKAINKTQPVIVTGTESWQDLYKRSVH